MTARIALGALGGTIAMAAPAPGGPVVPSLTADDLLVAAPGLGEVADVVVAQLANLPSASITVDHLLRALGWAEEQVAAGVDGVVLSQGTDTLEESAFLLDLLWSHDAPLVLTGAMRAAHAPGADGPANLLTAARVAVAAEARGLGVLVCLAEEAHLASRVTKADSFSVGSFESPGTGPVGRVVEGRFRRSWTPLERPAALTPPAPGRVSVPLVEATLDDDAAHLRAVLATGPRGVVIGGSGAGHVSAGVADVVGEAVADGVTVVVAARTARGGTARDTYGYPGSEVDLVRRGALMAGELPGRKARLLLHVLLAAGAGREAIDAEITVRGGRPD